MRTQIQTQIRSLSSLLENLRDGIIQVPPFQREFVWTRKQIVELFDSISKGYPIGSILLWRPPTAPSWGRDREVGGFILPDLNEPKSYVLDGYQRLSSLFGCLNNPKTSGLEYDENMRKEFFNLCFDLKEEEFIYPTEGYAKPWQVPVYILFRTSEFRQYTRNILEPTIPDSQLLDTYLDRADSFSRILVEYKLAVIEVDGGALEDAVNIFSRINSKGTDISDKWKVNALSFTENFNFSTEIDNIIRNLSYYNFDKISSNIILKCFQSAFDDRLYVDTDINILAERLDFQRNIKNMSDAIIKAVSFLYYELNVIDHRLLPDTDQLIFLSVFFMKKPNPSKEKIKDIIRWFWITTYSHYFSLSSLSRKRKAFAYFLDYLEDWYDTPLYNESPRERMKTEPWPKKLSLSSARAVALALFQLRLVKENFGVPSERRHLECRKIFRYVDSLPENMAVTFACPESENYFPYYDQIGSDFLNLDKEDISNRLHYRRYNLQYQERKFVNSLGLIYNEEESR